MKKEIAEELALSAVARDNYFEMIKEDALKDGVEQELYAVRIETDPIEGVKLNYIKHENFIYGKTSNRHFTDCKYFGEVKSITVGQLKNIAKRGFLERELCPPAEVCFCFYQCLALLFVPGGIFLARYNQLSAVYEYYLFAVFLAWYSSD